MLTNIVSAFLSLSCQDLFTHTLYFQDSVTHMLYLCTVSYMPLRLCYVSPFFSFSVLFFQFFFLSVHFFFNLSSDLLILFCCVQSAIKPSIKFLVSGIFFNLRLSIYSFLRIQFSVKIPHLLSHVVHFFFYIIICHSILEQLA